jgi:glyoxylase-like metal-dependent hydrolase (beta-lactamase superfamily II)
VSPLPPGVELVTTSGTFELDGGSWEVTNNIWLVGDEAEVVIIDAAHDHRPVAEAVGDRRAVAIILTHGHNDHINAALGLRHALRAPVFLHPADGMLWDVVHPGRAPDGDLEDGRTFAVAGGELKVLHTPGHSPGSCCLTWTGPGEAGQAQEHPQALFTGDTLFCGGPGATGRSYSDEPTILRSIRDRLLPLAPATTVLTGHGEGTTVGAETDHVRQLVELRGLS